MAMGYPTPSRPLYYVSLRSTEEQVSSTEIADALRRILESPEWAQTARMADFLRFVVERTLEGGGERLKQTVIGVEVFGRDPDYDPKVDPVVRVEARRLRAKLEEYYSGSGANDPIRIELPKGAYQPHFVRMQPELAPAAPVVERAPSRIGSVIALITVAAVLALAALAGMAVVRRDAQKSTSTPRLLTDHQAYNRSPRFLGDGNQIVFSREDGPATSHIFIAPAEGGGAIALTAGSARDYEPVGSPDGPWIAYLRQTGPLEYSILVLGSRAKGPDGQTLVYGVKQRSSLAFSRDGQTLYFGDRPEESVSAAIYAVSLTSRERTKVTEPPNGIAGDAHPQISPDGSTLAFLRRSDEGVQDIFTQNIQGAGDARQVSREQRPFRGICWTADGRAILAGVARGDETGSIWRYPTGGGAPTRVAEAGIGAQSPAVSRTGDRLAFILRIADTNNWRVALGPNGRVQGQAEPLTTSPVLDTSPQISPDGSQIAWRSSSTGTNEIWVGSSKDSSQARPITSMRGPVTGSPRWSPDGKEIVFESRQDGHGQIFVIPGSGGTARQLTSGAFNHILPSWSRDGRFIYFASDRSGQWQVWRTQVDAKDTQQITRHGGFAAFEAWDGRTLFYSRQSGGIWKVARDGGAETIVTAELTPDFWGQFSLSERGLFFMAASSAERHAIRRLDLATGTIRDAVPLTRLPVGWDSGMSVSRDESLLTWSQLDLGASDIYVLDGIR